MANQFYNPSGSPAVGSQGSSAVFRGEFTSIELGFDLLPDFTDANALFRTNNVGTGYVPMSVGVENWTPTLTCTTPGNLSVSYTTRVGKLTRVGRFVVASINVVTSSFTWTTASGSIGITGLPSYTSLATGGVGLGASIIHAGPFANASGFKVVRLSVTRGATPPTIRLNGIDNSGGLTILTMNGHTTSGTTITIQGSFFYPVVNDLG